MKTDMKPSDCPDFVTGMCPVCGLLVGNGYGPHPDAKGQGVEAALAHIGRDEELCEVNTRKRQ